MHRNSLLETAARSMHQIVRLTLNKANDDPMMQELSFDGMISEGRKIVERFQTFGFSSMPLPRDEQQQQGGQQGGGQQSGDTPQPKGPAAEGIAVYLGGQRNHPIVIAVDDRRHRPMGLKPGENAQYDDQGQMTLLRRGGLFLLSLDDDGSGQQPGAVMLRDKDGKATGQSQKQERMVSLRHVQKKKQQRGKVGTGSGSGGGGASGSGASAGTLAADGSSGGQSQQDYKHEGDTVNTEVRATAKDIQILDGENVVARYDKGSGTWTFTSKVMKINVSDTMTIDVKNKLAINGHPIVFNNGTPSVDPFQIP